MQWSKVRRLVLDGLCMPPTLFHYVPFLLRRATFTRAGFCLRIYDRETTIRARHSAAFTNVVLSRCRIDVSLTQRLTNRTIVRSMRGPIFGMR
eukprot:1833763-Lingulodinium_polyedra.AAC.1